MVYQWSNCRQNAEKYNEYWCMEDGRRHAGGGAADTPVAGHVTVRTAQCATIAALHQPICSPAAAREGHQWIDRWQELGELQ